MTNAKDGHVFTNVANGTLFNANAPRNYKSASFVVCMRQANHQQILTSLTQFPKTKSYHFSNVFRSKLATLDENAQARTDFILNECNISRPVIMVKPEHPIHKYVHPLRQQALILVISAFDRYAALEKVKLIAICRKNCSIKSPYNETGQQFLTTFFSPTLSHHDLCALLWAVELLEALGSVTYVKGMTYIVSEKVFCSSHPDVKTRLELIQLLMPVKGVADKNANFLMAIRHSSIRYMCSYVLQQIRLTSTTVYPNLSRLSFNLNTQARQLSFSSIIASTTENNDSRVFESTKIDDEKKNTVISTSKTVKSPSRLYPKCSHFIPNKIKTYA